jgi:hypothetical protein
MMEKIPFETEINNFLKELFYENWMDENDWQMFLEETNISIENLSNDLQIGLKNGYSIQGQFDLVRVVLKK